MSRWPRNMTIEQKFDALYEPVPWSGCWLWLGYGTKEEYGRLQVGAKKYLAHRLSYQRFVGDIPPGMLVLHRCDTPSCVNPYHLFLGTDAINTLDKVAKGRHAHGKEHAAWSRGELQHMAKLNAEKVIAIRNDNRPHPVIANDYGISSSNVSFIKRRITWKHV